MSDVAGQLAQTYSALEEKKTVVLNQVAGWRTDRLAFCPDPGSWSALQVIDHLRRTEAGVLQTMELNLGKSNAITLQDRTGTAMMLLLMRTPVKVKTPPAASAILPGSDLELATVSGLWERTRAEMRSLLPKIAPAATSRGLFRHPVTGWMNAPETLSFLLVHLKHHLHQLRNLERISSRAAA